LGAVQLLSAEVPTAPQAFFDGLTPTIAMLEVARELGELLHFE